MLSIFNCLKSISVVNFLYTNRLFGGLMQDIHRKLPFYVSDFKDAIHVQSLASFMFLYFACLTPIITFGGLLADATDKDLVSTIFTLHWTLLFCYPMPIGGEDIVWCCPSVRSVPSTLISV